MASVSTRALRKRDSRYRSTLATRVVMIFRTARVNPCPDLSLVLFHIERTRIRVHRTDGITTLKAVARSNKTEAVSKTQNKPLWSIVLPPIHDRTKLLQIFRRSTV